MCDGLHVVLMSLIDDGAAQFGGELLDGLVAVVDPQLDDIGLHRGEFAYRRASFCLVRNTVGDRSPVVGTGAGIGHRHASTGGAE